VNIDTISEIAAEFEEDPYPPFRDNACSSDDEHRWRLSMLNSALQGKTWRTVDFDFCHKYFDMFYAFPFDRYYSLLPLLCRWRLEDRRESDIADTLLAQLGFMQRSKHTRLPMLPEERGRLKLLRNSSRANRLKAMAAISNGRGPRGFTAAKEDACLVAVGLVTDKHVERTFVRWMRFVLTRPEILR
jgi:hypothetical protein